MYYFYFGGIGFGPIGACVCFMSREEYMPFVQLRDWITNNLPALLDMLK